jgi:gliding motility-associated-like protein
VTASPSLTIGSSTIANAPHTNALIAEFSSSGTPLWGQASSGAICFSSGITSDNAGNVFMVGEYEDTTLNFSTATTHVPPFPNWTGIALFLVKYSPANTPDWAKTIASPTQHVRAYAVAVSSTCQGKVWVDGGYEENVVVAPGDTIALDSGIDQLFIASYDQSGTPSTYLTTGSGGDDEADICFDTKGNLFICGDYYADSLYSFVLGNDTLTNGGETFFIAKFANIQDTVFAHNDTTICVDTGAYILTAPSGYFSYLWDNDSVSLTRKINAAGKYYVYCLNCDTTLIDTFNVQVATPDTTFKDTAICIVAGSIRLYAPVGYNSYLWNTGDTSSFIVALPGSNYWLYALGQNCSRLKDSFAITSDNIAFSLGNDTSACGPVILNAPSFAATYTWQDGSAGTSFQVTKSGIYYLSISSQGCTYADTISVSVEDAPNAINDTILCRGQSISFNLSAKVPAGWKLLWNDGSTQNSLYVTDTGSYWVQASDSACTVLDTAIVSTAYCDCLPLLPTAFTPNGDGRNDEFRCIILPSCPISDFKFSIYNRWGEQVFSSSDPQKGWDGKLLSVPAEIGVYEYQLEFTAGSKKVKHFLKGDVTLIR